MASKTKKRINGSHDTGVIMSKVYAPWTWTYAPWTWYSAGNASSY